MIASRHDIAARGSGQRRAMVQGLSLLLCIAAWAACAGAGAVGDATDGLTVLPPQWNDDGLTIRYVSEADARRLTIIADSTFEEIEAMLGSDDPRMIGAGVFAAAAKGDLQSMLHLDRQVDDHRATLPRPAYSGSSAVQLFGERDPGPTRPQTVADLTESVLLDWFGLRVSSGAELRAAREGIADPEALIRPWVVRIRMARGDDRRLDPAVMAAVEALPEPQRWGVIAEATFCSVLREDEARPLLEKLSPELRAAIAEGRAPAHEDPLFTTYPSRREALAFLTRRVLDVGDWRGEYEALWRRPELENNR